MSWKEQRNSMLIQWRFFYWTFLSFVYPTILLASRYEKIFLIVVSYWWPEIRHLNFLSQCHLNSSHFNRIPWKKMGKSWTSAMSLAYSNLVTKLINYFKKFFFFWLGLILFSIQEMFSKFICFCLKYLYRLNFITSTTSGLRRGILNMNLYFLYSIVSYRILCSHNTYIHA